MASWAKICEILEKYANRENEMTYQKSIIDLLLETNLGWDKNQIEEQMSMQLGSTERLIPDVVVTKNNQNKFVMEVKEPAHVRTQKNIDQLVSYMKQLETSVGIYVGKELEVYFKNIGDGSEPKLILRVDFNPADKNGEDFLRLFHESEFSIECVLDYMKARDAKIAFEENVNELVSHFLSPDFADELKLIIGTYFSDRGDDVVAAALDAVSFNIHSSDEEYDIKNIDSRLQTDEETLSYTRQKTRRKGGNNGVAQRYAYSLIKQIIEKNPTLNFRQLYAIFDRKNRIEDITQVKDESRWCMDDEDVIKISDGTRVVISNQWGFNGHSKDKMDSLRSIALKYGIDVTLP